MNPTTVPKTFEATRAASDGAGVHRSTLTAELSEIPGHISPASDLPLDALRCVFEAWAAAYPLWEMGHGVFKEDKALVPFTAAAVCQHWRYVALKTPSIWSYIALADMTTYGQSANEESSDEGLSKYGDALVEAMQVSLCRSGSMPLDILFQRVPMPWLDDHRHFMMALFQQSHRWRTFDMTTVCASESEALSDLFHGGLPRLEKLYLSTLGFMYPEPTPHWVIVCSAPSLTWFCANDVRLGWSFMRRVEMPAVRYLSWHYCVDDVKRDPKELFTLATACPNLQTLDLDFGLADWISASPPGKISLSKLTTLQVTNPYPIDIFPTALHLPALRNLTVCSATPSLSFVEAYKASLKSIVIINPEPALSDETARCLRVADQLESITISCCNNVDASFFRELSDASLPRWTHLELSYVFMEDCSDALLAFLTRRTRCSEDAAPADTAGAKDATTRARLERVDLKHAYLNPHYVDQISQLLRGSGVRGAFVIGSGYQ